MVNEEKNAKITDPKILVPDVKSRVTTTINSDLVKLAKVKQATEKKGWTYQELFEFAIRFKIAEEDEEMNNPYPESRLQRKLEDLTKALEFVSKENENLKEKFKEELEAEARELKNKQIKEELKSAGLE